MPSRENAGAPSVTSAEPETTTERRSEPSSAAVTIVERPETVVVNAIRGAAPAGTAAEPSAIKAARPPASRIRRP